MYHHVARAKQKEVVGNAALSIDIPRHICICKHDVKFVMDHRKSEAR